MFSDDEVKAAMEHGAKAGGAFGTALLPGITAVMTFAVELAAARSGTMTAEELALALGEIDKLKMPKHWPHDYTACVAEHITTLGSRNAVLESQLPEGMKDCTIIFHRCPLGHGRLIATNWIEPGCIVCERDAALKRAGAAEFMVGEVSTDIRRVREENTVLKEKLAVLERLAYIGEHRFPDLTWKARCEELTKECNELRARAETAEADLVDAHATTTELRVSNARLLAASSAFTHELDERGGPAPGQCANPDPTTGPTCTERGCEGQTCQYPRSRR